MRIMAANSVAALLLLLALHSSLCVGVHAGGKDYGFECPQGKDSDVSREELEALLAKDLAAEGSELATTGGNDEEAGGSGFWSWLARLNGVGADEESSSEHSALAAKKRWKGGHHPKGVGHHPKGVGMRKGKGMHGKKKSRPTVTPGGFKADIVVAADGSGQYKKVQAAINAAKKGFPGKPFTIFVKAGSYFEKCVVPYELQHLTIIGVKGKTRIYYDDSAGKLSGDHTTARSASFTVLADDFTAVDVTFENTFGWPGGREGSQAVALLADGDRMQFYGCKFLSHQDTLFSKAGRQYYYKCHIIGQVDFIFGNARAIYQDCLVEVINNADNRYTAVCAQNRPSKDYESGFVFLGGSVIGTGAAFPEYGAYLGRTWGPWSTVIFIRVKIDVPVRPEGWSNMAQPKNAKHAILLVSQSTGAGLSGSGDWEIGRIASAGEVSKYDGLKYIDGSWVAQPSWWKG